MFIFLLFSARKTFLLSLHHLHHKGFSFSPSIFWSSCGLLCHPAGIPGLSVILHYWWPSSSKFCFSSADFQSASIPANSEETSGLICFLGFFSSFSAYLLLCLLRSCNSVLCPHAKGFGCHPGMSFPPEASGAVIPPHLRFQSRFPEDIARCWVTCIPARGTIKECKDGSGVYCLWVSHTALDRSLVLECSPSLQAAEALLAALN